MKPRHFKTALQRRIEIFLLLLVAFLSLLHIADCEQIQIIPNLHDSKPNSLSTTIQSRRSRLGQTSLDVVNWKSKPLTPEHIPSRLLAAALFRDNIVTILGRVLLLRLDEESRVSFQKIKDAIHARHVPTYELLPILPIINEKIPRQQLYSVLQVLERIGSSYVSSYASLCREGLTDGRVNMELTLPIDLLAGIDNTTLESLAMDNDRKTEVPMTLVDALYFLMDAVASSAMQIDLHLIAVLMLNLPAFDVTNPEVLDTMRYTADYMMQHSRSNDPLLKYIGSNEMRSAEHLTKAVLERIESADLTTTVLRESASLLLQNLNVEREPVFFNDDDLRKVFDVVIPDFYPRDVVDVAKLLTHRLDDSDFAEVHLMPCRGELQSLFAVTKQLYRRVSLPESLRESLSALLPFVVEKMRKEKTRGSLSSVLKYLNAFRTPCMPKKLDEARETLRPMLTKDLPWSLAFGNVSPSGDPRESLVNVLIELRSTETSKELALAIDDFIYHAQSSGIIGHPNMLHQLGILFQREDSHEVELDLYSLLARVPNVFKDARFSPLLTFLAKPNILDYIGRGFNKFAQSRPRDLFLDLIKRAMLIPAVRTNAPLMRALEVCERHLEEPILVNKFTQEDLLDSIKSLPGIENDPRYLPLKLLFKKQNLFKHISPSFSIAGLESPMECIVLVLNTVILKPIDPRLSESITFALSNIEGPSLPARFLNREDFVYLVNQLFPHNKKLEMVILNSNVYQRVGEWNIAVSGTPENVLARILTYPSAALAENAELSKTVEEAELILEEDTWQEVDLLKKKTLDAMLTFLPETANLRPVNLLLKKANLAMFIPHLNVTSLDEKEPREALIILLQNLISSPHILREKLLSRRLEVALHTVQRSANAPPRAISSPLTEELLDPLDGKYKPLWEAFESIKNSTIPLTDSRASLREFLLRLQEENGDEKLKEAAKQALEELTHNVKFATARKIEAKELLDVLDLLPNQLEVQPLRKLLLTSWIHEILPQGFQSSDYTNREQLLRAILYILQQRHEIVNDPQLIRAVSLAEESLGGWEINVEPLKKMIGAVKTAVYEPVVNLMTAEHLNKMNVSFSFEPERAPRQSLIILLHKLILHPHIRTDSKFLQLLDAVKQDVQAFGVDVDLLSVLDNAGVSYSPDLAPLRLFLRDKQIAEKFGPLVFATEDHEKQFEVLKALLQKSPDVNADRNLLEAVQHLTKIHGNFTKHSSLTVSDLSSIINLIPEGIVRQYSDLRQVFTADVFRRLTQDDEIVRSSQPLTTLMMKILNLPEIMRNYTISSRLVEMFGKLNRAEAQIVDYQIKPLLRELYHIRQYNIDFLQQLINPEALLVYLPDGLDMSGDNTDILNEILAGILRQRVAESNEELRNQILSIQRDLELTTGPNINSKKGLSRADIEQIIAVIPKESSYELVIHLLQTGGILGMLPKRFDWSKLKTPEKKLIKILTLVEGSVRSDDYFHQSIRSLKMYLLEKFKFINEENVEVMRGLLNGLSADLDIVPLKLFFTHENLIKYLPNDFSLKGYNSPKQALIAILNTLSGNSKLQRRVELLKTIITVVKAMGDGEQRHSIHETNSRRTLTQDQLSIDAVKFILALEVKSPALRNFLSPKKLIRTLPASFSFAQRPTYKTKALHLLEYLVQKNTSLKGELKELISIVESFPDVPSITDKALVPLIESIPAKGIPNINLVTAFLKASKLRKLLPGNFDIEKHAEMKSNLRELIKILSFSLCGVNKRTMRAFAHLLRELEKPESSTAPKLPNVDEQELKLLLHEIPFAKNKILRPLEKTLTEDRVMKMLPSNFNLEIYGTKKLRMLGVLDKIKSHPDSAAMLESLNLAKKYIEDMPDAPKINDTDIKVIFKAITLQSNDSATLLRSCKADKLAAYLPIDFDIEQTLSRKNKVVVVLNSCKKIKSYDASVEQALANAKKAVKWLPNADLSKEELSLILQDISCSNINDLKPLKNVILKNNLLSSLPRNLNLETQRTVKQKLVDLLKALRNVKSFQNESLFVTLDTAERSIQKIANNPNITEEDIAALKKLSALQDRKSRPFSKSFTFENILKVVPTTFNVQDYPTDKSKLTALLNYCDKFIEVKTNKLVKQSLNYVKLNLKKEAEKETLKLLESLVESSDEYIPLKLYLMTQKQKFFQPIADVPHGFEYSTIEDRLRVVLKAMLKTAKVMQSKSLVDSINSMVIKLSEGHPTQYEIDEAIDQIENSKKYLYLKSTMRCKNIQKHFENFTLDAEYTPKRLLLHILKIVKTLSTDLEIQNVTKSLIDDVQRAVWDSEAEEMFKEIPNYKLHVEKLEAVRFYFILHGSKQILGEDFATRFPKKLERLRELCEKLQAMPNLAEMKDLKMSVEYLKHILMGGVMTTEEIERSIDDINVKSLFAALPKTRNEVIIVGILKFFADPNLLRTINLPKNPFDYKYKGPLLQAMIEHGLDLDSVMQDSQQQEALEYFKDKILMTGPGSQPIELKNFAKNSNMKVDLIGLMKAVDIRAVNVSTAVKVATFFDTKYDNLIHGLGFDQAPYRTRGTYLKAFLEHLISGSSVPVDFKRDAKALIPAVKLDGPGAEPVDINEEVVPDVRMFANEYYPLNHHGVMNNPPIYMKNNLQTIFSHLRNEQFSDPWTMAVLQRGKGLNPFNGMLGMNPLNHPDQREDYVFWNMPFGHMSRTSPLFPHPHKVLYDVGHGNVKVRKSLDSIGRPYGYPEKFEKRKSFSRRIGEYMNEKNDDDESEWSGDFAKEHQDLKDGMKNKLTVVPRVLPEIEVQDENSIQKSDLKAVKYITDKEAEKLRKKKRQPVKPLPVDPHELPKPLGEEEAMISHESSKHRKGLNLGNRKLFKINSDSKNLDDLSDGASVEDFEKQMSGGRSVKKDLSVTNSFFQHDLDDRGKSFNVESKNGTFFNIEKIRINDGNSSTPAIPIKVDGNVASGETAVGKEKNEAVRRIFNDVNEENLRNIPEQNWVGIDNDESSVEAAVGTSSDNFKGAVKLDLRTLHNEMKNKNSGRDITKNSVTVNNDRSSHEHTIGNYIIDSSVNPEQQISIDDTRIENSAKDEIDSRIIHHSDETSDINTAHNVDSSVNPDLGISIDDTRINSLRNNTTESGIIHHNNGTLHKPTNINTTDNVDSSSNPELRIFHGDKKIVNSVNDAINSTIIYNSSETLNEPSNTNITENINSSVSLDLRIIIDDTKNIRQSPDIHKKNESSHETAVKIDTNFEESSMIPSLRIFNDNVENEHSQNDSAQDPVILPNNNITDSIAKNTVEVNLDLIILNNGTKRGNSANHIISNSITVKNQRTDLILTDTVESSVDLNKRILSDKTNEENLEKTKITDSETIKTSMNPEPRILEGEINNDSTLKPIVHHDNKLSNNPVTTIEPDFSEKPANPNMRIFIDDKGKGSESNCCSSKKNRPEQDQKIEEHKKRHSTTANLYGGSFLPDFPAIAEMYSGAFRKK